MKLVVGNLINALALPAKMASKNKNTPVLRNVAIRGGDGNIIITATDMVAGCMTTAPAEGAEGFAADVDPAVIMGFLRTLKPDAEIEISVNGSEVLLKSGKSEAELPKLPEWTLPDIEIPEAVAHLPYGADYPYIFRLAGQCVAGPQDARARLQCVCVDYAHGVAYGTDGIQLARLSFPVVECSIPSPLFIPAQGLSYIVDAFDDGSELYIFDRGIMLKNKNTVVFVKDASQPSARALPLEQYDAMSPATSAHIETGELQEALSRLLLLGDSSVALTLSDAGAELRTVDALRGKGSETVPCDYTGDGVVTINFKPALLRGILHAVNAPTVKICIDGPRAPIKITVPDMPGLYALLMPVAP